MRTITSTVAVLSTALLQVVPLTHAVAGKLPAPQPIQQVPFSHQVPTEFVTGMFWSGLLDAVVVGSHAYCGTNGGVLVLDISDLSHPFQVAAVPQGSAAERLAVTGNLLLVANFEDGLQILDVAHPLAPRSLAGLELPSAAMDVAVSGHFAYVACLRGGLYVVDIQDPLNPTLLGSFISSDDTYGIEAEGNYAYRSDGYVGVKVFDVSHPDNPTWVSSLSTPGSPWDVDVVDGRAYVANSSQMQIYDVADPRHPVLMSSYATPSALSVTVRPPLAYLAMGAGGLHIIDVTNPASPKGVSTFNTPGHTYRVTLYGSYALVSDQTSLQILNVSNPKNPVFVGRFDTPAITSLSTLGFKANHWFLRWPGVVEVYDISNPAAIGLEKTYDQFGYIGQSSLEGDTAYFNEPGHGIHLVEVSDPLNPIEVGLYEGSVTSFSVTFPYLCQTSSGVFYTLDISDPTHPDTLYSARPIAPGAGFGTVHKISDALVGISTWFSPRTSNLDILDISSPSHGRRVGAFTWTAPYDLQDMTSFGDYVLILVSSSGVQVFHLMDGKMTGVGSYYIGQPSSIVMQGSYALVTDYLDGLTVLDMHDPARPMKVADFKTPGGARDVAVTGDLVFVRAGGAMFVLRVLWPLADHASTPDSIPASPVAWLGPNSPNPFNASTVIEFAIPQPADAQLEVFDVLGRQVRSWNQARLSPGAHQILWDGRDGGGRSVPSGLYFGRLTVAGQSATIKMVLLK